MPVSFSEKTSLECPECQVQFAVDAWTVVDAVERPDLAERCRNGSVFTVTCPNGHTGVLSSPLLYHDSAKQMLVLAMPPEVDDAAAQEIHQQLMERLTDDLTDVPPEYMNATRVVPPQFLSVALADDPEAAFEAYRAAQQAAAQLSTPEERALSEVLRGFIQAPTWEESRRILEAHPELTTDDADGVFSKLIDAAKQYHDDSTERILETHRELLRNVREQGAEAAFAQVRSAAGNDATLPPDIAARLQELNVQTQADLDRAVEEHPDLAAAVQGAPAMNDSGVAALRELSTAQSPQDVLRAARRFPILLEDEFLNRIKELVLDARAQGVKEAEGHWNRCLQTLLELQRSGASPQQWEEVGQHLQNAEAVQVFQELAALGVNSEETLEQVLQERPDLLERWNRATQPSDPDTQADDGEGAETQGANS